MRNNKKPTTKDLNYHLELLKTLHVICGAATLASHTGRKQLAEELYIYALILEEEIKSITSL